MLRHLLALAYGNPCHVCRIGAPLVDLHVATAGQLAVHLASSLLLCEPWMPHEYIFRLSDMREPRSSHPPPSKSHALATMAKAKAHAPLNRTHSTTSRGSDRTPEAPWQSSFRVKETSASSHASRSTGRTDTYEKQIKDRVDGQSLYSQSDSLFSESEGNDDGSASSRPSSDGPQVPVFDFGTPQLFTKPTGAPLHSRSKSSSTTNGSTRSSLQAAGILPSLPPLPSNAMPPPLPTANMPTDISPLTADLAKIGIPSSHLSPVLKPILKPHSALPPLPPLPTANMPTDISPLAADLTKMGIPSSHMPPVLKPILKPQNAPPPLPSQPMPSFQPSSYTPQTSSGGFMPMKSAAPPSLPYATESMSAEALMLLNFDKIHK
ncbi:hypothetical protein FBU59_006042 [Linderina macrospora]|uniref:Uncharacterized protein n=1 Tax=Linderina macrospora TaxID=4868 RepID=A0ACC1J111_9FUNG|nr:hypothetical protein FBU59_006042 [Linderina macrospora]